MPLITGETAVALVGALGGGLFVKLIDRHYQLKEKSIDAGASLRTELHQEIGVLKADLKVLQTELDTWKAKYYGLFERHALLKAKVNGLRQRIKALTGEDEPVEDDGEDDCRVGSQVTAQSR
jgi:predicted nuclease with TOPRIM domain